MNTLDFFVPGVCVPKARPRFGGGKTYTPKRTKDWERTVKHHALETRLRRRNYGFTKDSRFIVDLSFALTDGRTMRADVDNLAKAVLDALNGIAYKDDAQVTTLIARKFLARDAKAGVLVRVTKEEP